MTIIMDIDPADFGGAAAHVAAAQVFEFLTNTEHMGGLRAVAWYGGDREDGEQVQADVLAMARYINGRQMSGEQVWRKALIDGIVPGRIYSGRFEDLPIAQRMAYDMFAIICAAAHDQLDLVQIEISKAEVHAAAMRAAEGSGLKLEDSIFEPHGSLGELEPHQRQYLADQQTIDAQRTEEERLDAEREATGIHDGIDGDPPASLSPGAPIDDQPPAGKPASISIGIKEGQDHEKETTGQGQEAGAEGGADPGAQGALPDMADDGSAADGTPAPAAGQPAGPAAEDGELAAPVADAGAGESGGDDGAAGAEPVTAPAKPKRPSRGKSKT
jgi:hypothetical protein